MKIAKNTAKAVADKLGIDFGACGFSLEEYAEGMNIELEHGIVDAETNVTNDDFLVTGKIALAHLKELPCYYNEAYGLEAWEYALEHIPEGKTPIGIQLIYEEH